MHSVSKTLARLVLTLLGAAACGAPDLEPLRSPLLPERTAAELAADLDAFVPSRRQRAGVPGVAVAVVRDGEIVFVRGYGVADLLTRRPVTPRTVFEVASHSKPVTAYAALRLVAQGALELDTPLAGLVDEPFLPPSPESDRVTLRQVLSHSSGLSNLGVGLLTDRHLWFPPGDHFSYSGHGYSYLGRALEDVTGEPLAAHLEHAVLEPLGMTRSGYRLQRAIAEQMARPHLPAWLVAGATLGLLLLLALLVSGPGWIVLRVARRLRRLRAGGSSASRRPGLVAVLGLAAVAGSAAWLLGPTALCGLAVLACVAGPLGAALWVGRALWRSRELRSRPRGLALAGLAAACIALAGFVATRPAVPLPKRELDIVAAGGLLATAPDLARFLAELMAPRELPAALAREMIAPQVGIDGSLSWGLGVGLQHSGSGDSVWHWGLNPGFESLMVGYPAERLGVVVLSNGGPSLAGLRLAREIVHRAVGGEHGGYWADVPGTGLPAR